MKKSVLASVQVPGRTIQHPPSSGADLTSSSHRSLHRPPNRITTAIVTGSHSRLFQLGLSSHY